MIEKNCRAQWGFRRWLASLTIIVGASTIALRHINASENNITDTISKAEPPVVQYGTAMHPYADASQCPASTDVVFWPTNDRPVPNIPSEISVCFVGTGSLTNAGPDQRVRDH